MLLAIPSKTDAPPAAPSIGAARNARSPVTSARASAAVAIHSEYGSLKPACLDPFGSVHASYLAAARGGREGVQTRGREAREDRPCQPTRGRETREDCPFRPTRGCETREDCPSVSRHDGWSNDRSRATRRAGTAYHVGTTREGAASRSSATPDAQRRACRASPRSTNTRERDDEAHRSRRRASLAPEAQV